MAVPKALRDVIVPGAVFEVTNHYITREDHPCFGTRTETIARVNSASFYVGTGGLPWPKASAFRLLPDGTVELYGLGAGQGPADLFMSLRPVAARTETVPTSPVPA